MPRRISLGDRAVAALLALACLGVLLVAAGLRADDSGAGTHEQIGLPPCGFLAITGKPCATCGMTTAFAHAANGRLFTALKVQPAGLFAALILAALFWGAGYAAMTGSSASRLYSPLLRPRCLWAAGLLFLLAWGYKMLTY